MWLDDLAQSIANDWTGRPINVVYRDGVAYSLDNRRLAASKLLDIRVPVRVESLNDPRVAREFAIKDTGLKQGTEGRYIDVLHTNLRINLDGSITIKR